MSLIVSLFEGIPWFIYDQRGTNEKTDDRLLIHMTGQPVKIFDAAQLTDTNFAFTGKLPSVLLGSNTFGGNTPDPLEFGELSVDNSNITYTSQEGIQYHAKLHRITQNGVTRNTVLVDRIEQPNLDFDPSLSEPGRKGIAFVWDTTMSATIEHPRLKEIRSSDGSITRIAYSDTGYMTEIKVIAFADATSSETVLQTIPITIEPDPTDASIKQLKTIGGSKSRREFSYNKGVMTTDTWTQPGTDFIQKREFLQNQTSGRLTLSGIRLGAVAASGASALTDPPQPMVYMVTPWVSSTANSREAIISQTVSDLLQLNSLQNETTSAGTYKTTFQFNADGQTTRKKIEFGTTLLSEQKWTYDHLGSVQSSSDRTSTDDAFQTTFFGYDYAEIAKYKNATEDLPASLDNGPVYDPTDYRGNITRIISTSGYTNLEFETDNELGWARGKLVKKSQFEQIDSDGTPASGGPKQVIQSYYEYDSSGRLLRSSDIRGSLDSILPGNDGFVPNAESDRTQQWTYYANNEQQKSGYLKSYTDELGQRTEYLDYFKGQPWKINTTTLYPGKAPEVTLSTLSYAYNATGLTVEESIKKNDQQFRSKSTLFDVNGNISQMVTKVLAPLITITERSTFAPNGTLLESTNANGVKSKFQYTNDGLLRQSTKAQGQTYRSVYTQQDESVEQSTVFEYYADGSLKKSTEQDGKSVRYYENPAARKSWQVVPGVSQNGGLANSVTETTTDFLGRTVRVANLLSGSESLYEYTDARIDMPTKLTTKVNLGWQTSSWNIADDVTQYRYDGLGQLLATIEDNRRMTVRTFDALGYVNSYVQTSVNNDQQRTSEIEFETNPAGQNVLIREKRRNNETGSTNVDGTESTNSKTLVTKFQYDQAGRLRKTEDPLLGIEPSTVAATIDYSYDSSGLIVNNIDRNGTPSLAKVNPLGQVFYSRSTWGEITELTFDPNGNVITEQASGLATKTYQYDQHDRLRAVILTSAGSTNYPQFSAVDYFDTISKPGNWDIIEIASVSGIDPKQDRTNVKANLQASSSKRRLDALGRPIATELPDPDYVNQVPQLPLKDNTTTSNVTYSFHPATKTLTATSAITSEGTTRFERDIRNVQGEVLADFRQKDGTANNTSTPGALNSPGYQLNQVYVYDTLGSLKSTSYPAGTPQDTNAGPLVAARWEYDDLGRKIKAFDSGATTAFSEFRYDSAGNLTFERDENGVENLVLFDELSRPLNLRTSIPAPTETNLQARDQYFATWEYEGNKSSYTNRNGWKTETLVDHQHNKIRETSEIGTQSNYKETSFSNGRPTSALERPTSISSTGSTKPRTSDATFEYDELGRVKMSSSGFVFDGFVGLNVENTAEFDRAGSQVSSGLSLNNYKIYTDTLKYDGLGRVLSQKQVFDRSAQSSVWKSGKAPRDKLVTYKYKGELLDSMQRSEIPYTGDPAHFANTDFGYTPDGRLKSANHSFEFRIPSSTSTQNALRAGSASVVNTYDNRGFVSSIKRTVNVADEPSQALNELISFYRNETGLITSQGIKQLGTTLPEDTYVLAPGFTAAPGGLVKNDGRYSFKYDGEGNVTERTSLFQPITIDDQDDDRVTRSACLNFPENGKYPIGGSVQTDSRNTLFCTNVLDTKYVKFSFPEIENEGDYDLWTTWVDLPGLGQGNIEVKVGDAFTGGRFDRLEKDLDTGYFKRGNSEGEYIPINFNVHPRYEDGTLSHHVDKVRWQFVGTLSLEKRSNLRVLFYHGEGAFAVDAVRLTAHIAKEKIEYDHLNRPIKVSSFSLNPSTPSQIKEYAYDVLGRLVANRFVAPDANESDSFFTVMGYAYQGNKQVLSYLLADSITLSTSSIKKINSFSFLSLSGDLLAKDDTTTETNGIQLSAWQMNDLNGQTFTNSKTLSRQKHPFAGFKTSTSSTDFMDQSRETNKSAYRGGTVPQYGLIDRFANLSDASMIGGTIVVSIGVAFTLPVSSPTLSIGSATIIAGGSLSGGISNATSEYLRGGDSINVGAAFAGGAGWSAWNPLSGYMSLAGGLVGAGISKWNGGSTSEGFQWGELAGGFVGGGIQHYGRALAKYTAGGNGAKAAGMALRHTAAAMGVEGSGIAVGAGVGGYYGGSSGALAGAQLGQLAGGLAANFAVACFTAGTPLVVDLEGNSRPIDEIEVGDFVLARSEFDPAGPLELKRVEEKFVRTSVVMELVVHGQSIKTTAEHPFYVPLQGKFVAAGELQVGEHLVGHDGNLVQIESIGSTGEVTTVYNLRVADFHTYFVGGTIWGWDVWVHNALYGTQNPITAWAAKTGRAYDRRFRAIWRQFEGQTIGDWEVAAVNRRLAKGIQPDLVLVDHQMKTVNVHDFTSAYSDAHYAKGLDYVMHLKKQYMGYRVEYTESYWANSTMTVEATAKNGVKYLPGTSKP